MVRTFGNPIAAGTHFTSPVAANQGYGDNKFQPLPHPTKPAPYHLQLEHVLTAEKMQQITEEGKINFHVVGDTGGVNNPQHQIDVATQMLEDFDTENKPAFCYNLGDVVYFFGEGKQYYPQFYEPYIHYNAPIFAIPGNHDADLWPTDKATSLESFVKNFCNAVAKPTDEAGDARRDAMTQPHVYWTLETPYATFVGLYTNVPEHGVVDDTQKEWLINEFKTAPTDKALILTMHHPIYSGDIMIVGSPTMKKLYDETVQASSRKPNLVLAGHVHNYQRFDLDGIPFIVNGAGGYYHLHAVAKKFKAKKSKSGWKTEHSDAVLMSYNDKEYGYLQMTASPTELTGNYVTVSGKMFDKFTVKIS